MKKLYLAGAVALALSLGACGGSIAPPSNIPHVKAGDAAVIVEAPRQGGSYAWVGTWTDPKTGCEYFVGEASTTGVFMSPRMSNGVAICHEQDSTEYQTYQRLKKQYEGK